MNTGKSTPSIETLSEITATDLNQVVGGADGSAVDGEEGYKVGTIPGQYDPEKPRHPVDPEKI